RYFHVTGVQTCALPICTTWRTPSGSPRDQGVYGNRTSAAILPPAGGSGAGALSPFRGRGCTVISAHPPVTCCRARWWITLPASRSDERRVGKVWRPEEP